MKGTFPVVALLLTTSGAVDADRVGRPMVIHRIRELGLEIWTEQDPLWETRLIDSNDTHIFIAETPALTYPPALMSWASPEGFLFEDAELEFTTRGVIHQAVNDLGGRVPQKVVLTRKQYGELAGYESSFTAMADGEKMDVLVFCGHKPGKPAVIMQVTTMHGQLPRLREHMRRSWNNVRYLQ